jgi:hypothetical protein
MAMDTNSRAYVARSWIASRTSVNDFSSGFLVHKLNGRSENTVNSFWNRGETRYAEAALAPNFFDRTVPSGRPQGLKGVLEASKNFRAAIPDLRAEIEELFWLWRTALLSDTSSRDISPASSKL